MSHSLTYYLDKEIFVRMVYDKTYTGELFCIDLESQMFIIRQKTPSGFYNYYLLRTTLVCEVKALSRDLKENESNKRLPAVDWDKIEARERSLASHFETNRLYYGVGVTYEAQEIFDNLMRSFTCRWRGQDIECNGVILEPPYSVDNCRGNDVKELDKVKRTLQSIRSNLRRSF